MYTAALRTWLPGTPGRLGKLLMGSCLFVCFLKKRCFVFLRKGTIWKHLNPNEPSSKFMDGCSLMTFSQWQWTAVHSSSQQEPVTENHLSNKRLQRWGDSWLFLLWRSTKHSCQTACLLDWKSCTSRNRKGRRQWLLLSWLEWLPKSHTWEGISHVCNTRMWCFPEWIWNREVSISLPRKVSTWLFQQNAKSAFPVQLVTPLDLLGSKCNGNTPALWLENTIFWNLLYG